MADPDGLKAFISLASTVSSLDEEIMKEDDSSEIEEKTTDVEQRDPTIPPESDIDVTVTPAAAANNDSIPSVAACATNTDDIIVSDADADTEESESILIEIPSTDDTIEPTAAQIEKRENTSQVEDGQVKASSIPDNEARATMKSQEEPTSLNKAATSTREKLQVEEPFPSDTDDFTVSKHNMNESTATASDESVVAPDGKTDCNSDLEGAQVNDPLASVTEFASVSECKDDETAAAEVAAIAEEVSESEQAHVNAPFPSLTKPDALTRDEIILTCDDISFEVILEGGAKDAKFDQAAPSVHADCDKTAAPPPAIAEFKEVVPPATKLLSITCFDDDADVASDTDLLSVATIENSVKVASKKLEENFHTELEPVANAGERHTEATDTLYKDEFIESGRAAKSSIERESSNDNQEAAAHPHVKLEALLRVQNNSERDESAEINNGDEKKDEESDAKVSLQEDTNVLESDCDGIDEESVEDANERCRRDQKTISPEKLQESANAAVIDYDEINGESMKDAKKNKGTVDIQEMVIVSEANNTDEIDKKAAPAPDAPQKADAIDKEPSTAELIGNVSDDGSPKLENTGDVLSTGTMEDYTDKAKALLETTKNQKAWAVASVESTAEEGKDENEVATLKEALPVFMTETPLLSASQSWEDRKSVTSLQPNNQTGECTNLATEIDLTKSKDLSANMSHDSTISSVLETNELDSLQVSKDEDQAVMETDPPATAPVSARTPSDSHSCISYTSLSFQGQRDPDGDCEFLDRTLNMSAVDTNTKGINASTCSGLHSLIMAGIDENNCVNSSLNELKEGDAPGNVMTTSVDSSRCLEITEFYQEDPSSADHVHTATSSNRSYKRDSTQGFEFMDTRNSFEAELKECNDSNSAYVSAEESWEGNTRNSSEAEPKLFNDSNLPYISAEESWEGNILVRGQSSSPQRDSFDLSPVQRHALKISIDEFSTELTLSKSQQPRKEEKKLGSSVPIARARKFPADPEGIVVDKQEDPSLLGGSIQGSSRARPRVSFAAMHTSAGNTRLEKEEIHFDIVKDRSSLSLDDSRRQRFAEYLRRRMIDHGTDEEEIDDNVVDDDVIAPLQNTQSYQNPNQGDIPRILDPTCASVESSFTTLVSRADDDTSTNQSAINLMRRSYKPTYEEESDGESTCGSESEYTYATFDDRSTNMSVSCYTEADTSKDDVVPKWCDAMVLPSVYQLEDFLADIMLDKKKKVTERPHNSDQKALSEFVDELENEEPLAGDTGEPEKESNHDEKENTVSVASNNQTSVMSKATASQKGAQAGSVFSQEPDEWGLLTFADMKEMARMAASAVETGAKSVNAKTKQSLSFHSFSLISRSTSAANESPTPAGDAPENVEQTANDVKSVVDPTVAVKSKIHSRITAKLQHIKKTQPQVYKVFLAKMAAAEKSGRKLPSKGKELSAKKPFPKTASASAAASPDQNPSEPSSDELLTQTSNNETVGSRREEDARKNLSKWESFDGSPFKETKTGGVSLIADSPDDDISVASFLDDLKWLGSAKDSIATKMESFIGESKEMTKPLKEKLSKYTRRNPQFYRSLVKRMAEQEWSTTSFNDAASDGSSTIGPKEIEKSIKKAWIEETRSKRSSAKNTMPSLTVISEVINSSLSGAEAKAMDLKTSFIAKSQDDVSTVDAPTISAFPSFPPSSKPEDPLESTVVKMSEQDKGLEKESLSGEKLPEIKIISEREKTRDDPVVSDAVSGGVAHDDCRLFRQNAGHAETEKDIKIGFMEKVKFFAKSTKPQADAPIPTGRKGNVASKASIFGQTKDQPNRIRAALSRSQTRDSQPTQSSKVQTRLKMPLQQRREEVTPAVYSQEYAVSEKRGDELQSITGDNTLDVPFDSPLKEKCGNNKLTAVASQSMLKTDGEQPEKKNSSLQSKQVTISQPQQRSNSGSVHDAADKKIQMRVEGSSEQKKDEMAQRSKTPLSSNRSGKPTSQKHTGTPRSSNYSQSKLFKALPKAKWDIKTKRAGSSKKKSAAIILEPSTPPSSHWEQFEQSTFTSFQANGNVKQSQSATPSRDRLPNIDLEA